MLINQKSVIRETSKRFSKKICPQHQVSYVQKVCTHSTCIESMSSSFLCNPCFRKHSKNHNGVIQYYLEFDKIFSENVFADIEVLENRCLTMLFENKQRLDVEVDKHCDIIIQEITQLVESIKIGTKLKYGAIDLVDKVLKLKESLQSEYNTLFSIDEANIKDEDVKQYLEFYLNYEKIFDQNQAKCEEIHEDTEKELSSISQLFNQKLQDIKSILESDIAG